MLAAVQSVVVAELTAAQAVSELAIQTFPASELERWKPVLHAVIRHLPLLSHVPAAALLAVLQLTGELTPSGEQAVSDEATQVVPFKL
jgi:hypothetical protein